MKNYQKLSDEIDSKVLVERKARHELANSVNKRINTEVENLDNKIDKKPSYTLFIGVVMAAIVVFGFFWSEHKETQGELNAYQSATFTELKEIGSTLSSVKTEIGHIKEELNKWRNN